MQSIKVTNVKDEVVAFLDRKAQELSKISGRKISRNAYINLVLEKQLRDDLGLDDMLHDMDDKMDMLDEKFDLLTIIIGENKQANDLLISLIVHGEDVSEVCKRPSYSVLWGIRISP